MAVDLKQTLEIGTTYSLVFTETIETDDDGDPDIVDLTGSTAIFQINNLNEDPPVIIHESTTENGEIVITGAEGKVEITISDAITADFAAGNFNYAYRRTLGGKTTTLLKSDFEITASRIIDDD